MPMSDAMEKITSWVRDEPSQHQYGPAKIVDDWSMGAGGGATGSTGPTAGAGVAGIGPSSGGGVTLALKGA